MSIVFLCVCVCACAWGTLLLRVLFRMFCLQAGGRSSAWGSLANEDPQGPKKGCIMAQACLLCRMFAHLDGVVHSWWGWWPHIHSL